MAAKQKIDHAIWAIVPAAGIGKRMQSSIPKQYLLLNDRPVIEHTLNALLQNENITGMVIALRADDEYWPDIELPSKKPVLQTQGGKERADSVLNALNSLFQTEQFDENLDWVMVHDAVRPCLRQEDITKLVVEVGNDSNGGLLALPVRDTMKRQRVSDSALSTSMPVTTKPATVATTIDRENLWHALTPQYFPAKSLKNALEKARLDGLMITDESSAMELAGYAPRLVKGNEDNIKITRADDLRLASLYLNSQK